MPSSSAIRLWLRPRSRRSRLRRAPRKSFRCDISQVVNVFTFCTSQCLTCPHFLLKLFQDDRCFVRFQYPNRGRRMPDFSEIVGAPRGRFDGIERPYTIADVLRLRGSIAIEHTLARRGALKLWELLHDGEPVRALGALTGNQAMQMVRAGLKAIYLSGWQVAADANVAGQTYPDQSLYPANSGPALVKRLNNALLRADQIDFAEGKNGTYWLAPIVADAEAGFGGALNAFELMKAYIEAGAAGVPFEDQLASEKKCGHLGGKVLVPTSQ